MFGLSGRCVQCCLVLAVLGPAAVGGKKLDGAVVACNTCQSVAHLLSTTRKSEGGSDKKKNSEVVAKLFSDRDQLICSETKLKAYAEYLDIPAKTMAKKCKSIMPDKMEYKSAQSLKKLLLEQKPRSALVEQLCSSSTVCDKLWTKAEEPWRNWKQKAEARSKDKEEM
ncbi:unnamed protein product [Polarella glacialis]|uniref:Saposin B-type domain-containing protein n=1 Tax=Polarella glacialis TaxID=89957 RepID=A0A813KXS7_POLGL|nr:unnamed protein product [Polarella glacialis]|eukprot:CAMPEP_0115082810 /NCGR_PEP_ID=MMETSP0227-20121206/20141_1 /TAXON_ID=89957 /ORGANISM="Polarella glacialis, Strain CCMP 1383" /LENGTH=167 /DNA_ID=CAMNT_0002471007 /DNA_START=82 /DNA_END=585 /DNA_ORIENTATION=+